MKKSYIKLFTIATLSLLYACKSGNQEKTSNQSTNQETPHDTVYVKEAQRAGVYEVCFYNDKKGEEQICGRNLLVANHDEPNHTNIGDTVVVDKAGWIVKNLTQSKTK